MEITELCLRAMAKSVWAS